MQIFDTVIVGGGLAGLGCARTLKSNGCENFCIVSENIGGRAPIFGRDELSPAFYTRSDYAHLKPFLILGRSATIWKGRLITPEKKWNPFGILCRHPLKCMKFLFQVWAFDIRYQRFMHRSESMAQKEAIQEDPVLFRLYNQSAADFLTEHHLESLGPELIGTLVRVTRFISLTEASSFLMLWIWLLLVRRAYECTVDIEAMTAGLTSHIQVGSVQFAQRKGNDMWEVETRSGQKFITRHLVLATPITVTQKLLSMTEPKRIGLNVFMAKVRGRAKPEHIDGRYNVFPLENPDVSIVDGEDGTYELFSLRRDFDLSKYFENCTVLYKKQWQPATFAGKDIQKTDMGGNLYVIGDGNFPCMEAAYVSGMQVAKKLLAGVRHKLQ